jgi:hypothetical protein
MGWLWVVWRGVHVNFGACMFVFEVCALTFVACMLTVGAAVPAQSFDDLLSCCHVCIARTKHCSIG